MWWFIDGIVLLVGGCILILRARRKNFESMESESTRLQKSQVGHVAFLPVIGLALMFAGLVNLSQSAHQADPRNHLGRIVKGVNQKLPKQIDPNLTLRSLSQKEGILYYHYELHGVELSEYDPNTIFEFLKESQLATISNHQFKATYLKNPYEVRLNIRHQETGQRFQIAITKEEMLLAANGKLDMSAATESSSGE